MGSASTRAAPGRILVVEDDAETRRLLQDALEARGHTVEAVGSVSSADRVARNGGIDAVILDVWLPDGDGTMLCRAWRSSGLNLPILMLTARTDVGARVRGLDAGADDYLGKPFAMEELRARLGALLRRGARPLRREGFRRGPLLIDFARRQAWDGGQEVPFTRRELAVLECLAAEPGQPISREDLLEAVWGEATPETASSLEVIVARIRRKLDRGGGKGLIRTVRGVGYSITPAEGDGE